MTISSTEQPTTIANMTTPSSTRSNSTTEQMTISSTEQPTTIANMTTPSSTRSNSTTEQMTISSTEQPTTIANPVSTEMKRLFTVDVCLNESLIPDDLKEDLYTHYCKLIDMTTPSLEGRKSTSDHTTISTTKQPTTTPVFFHLIRFFVSESFLPRSDNRFICQPL
ncbi:hypothetical protein KSF78_0007519 [Schistosoma japonicum]|nr:hypothetical protein KSF78_0007519 [Schistosoma japonicum]